MKKLIILLIALTNGVYFGQTVTTWTNTSSSNLVSFDIADSKYTTDNGFIITGSTNNDKAFVSKHDSIGDTEWVRELEVVLPTVVTPESFGVSIFESTTGGYIVVGNAIAYHTSYAQGHKYAFAAKLSTNGTILWEKVFASTYQGTSNNSLPYAHYGLIGDVIDLGSDEYMISMNMRDSTEGTIGGDKYTGLVHLDGSGLILDSQMSPSNVLLGGATKTSDGGIIVTDRDEAHGFSVHKHDAAYNNVWSDNQWEILRNWRCEDIYENSSGNIVALGTKDNPHISDINQTAIITYDNSGTVLSKMGINNKAYTRIVEIDPDVVALTGDNNQIAIVNLQNDSYYEVQYDDLYPHQVLKHVDGLSIVGVNSNGDIKIVRTNHEGLNSCALGYSYGCEGTTINTINNGTTPNNFQFYPINELPKSIAFQGYFLFNVTTCQDETSTTQSFFEKYQRYASHPTTERVNDVSVLRNGSVLMVGSTDSYGQGSEDGMLTIYTHNGTFETGIAAGTSDSETYTNSYATSDCGYILGGIAAGNGYIEKRNSQNALDWSIKLNNIHQIDEINELANGDFLISGMLHNRSVFYRIDNTGSVVWSRDINSGDNQCLSGEFSSGNIIISFIDDDQLVCYLLNSSSNVIQSKDFVVDPTTVLEDMTIGSSNICHIVGSTDSEKDGFVFSLDENIAAINYGIIDLGGDEQINSVIEASNGKIVVSGEHFNYDNWNSDLFMLSIDHSFTPEWVKTYGGNYDELGGYISEAKFDNGYFLGGTSKAFGGNDDIYLIKTDSSGEAGVCYWEEKSYTWSTPSITSTLFSLSVTNLSAGLTSYSPIDTTFNDESVIINFSIDLTVTPSSCFGVQDGTAEVLSFEGGTAPHIITWDDYPGQTNLTNLASGYHAYIVQDASGCRIRDSIEITQPDQLSNTVTTFDATCNGAYNGSAYATTTGGTEPYNYFWSNGMITDTAYNFNAGTYTLNVTDANGCSDFDFITIGEPTAMTLSSTSTNNTCVGGNSGDITLTTNNGTAPYTYTWSDIGIGSFSRTGLTSGMYHFQVEDSCGTIISDSIEITEPQYITPTINITDVSCHGGYDGEISISVTGGSSPYNYMWYVDGSMGSSISSQSSGADSVLVTDNCGVSETVYYTINEPSQLTTTINSTNASCHSVGDGTIAVYPSGGTTPYLYSWSSGHALDSISGLFAGTYTVNVTDANGCLTSNFATVQQPTPIQVAFEITDATCNSDDGIVIAHPTGGTQGYTYSWSTTATTDTIFNVGQGYYVLEVTDANGCITSDSAQVQVRVDPVELCIITVDTSSTHNELVWEKPVSNNIAGFNIYRNIAGVYNQIAFQPYDSISSYTDDDFGIDPNITSYRYKISVVDSCGNESVLSAFHETIHVVAFESGGNINLIWDNYEGFSFNYYRIWRDDNGTGNNFAVLDSVTSSNVTYTDITAPSTNSLYFIEVVSPYTCTAEKAQDHNSTRSNRTLMVGNTGGGSNDITENNVLPFTVYPNPNNGEFNVILEEFSGAEWNYSILDVSGKMVQSGVGYQRQLNLTLSHVERGIYFLEVRSEGQKQIKRIIIQ